MSSNKFEWTDELVKEFAYDWLDDNFERFKVGESRLEKFKESKTKKPVLFTTEDGVEIRDELVNVYLVCGDFSFDYDCLAREVAPSCLPPSRHKIFSTKEKAEEYILMNKPCLSLRDVLRTSAIFGYALVPFEKEIEELAKTKIK